MAYDEIIHHRGDEKPTAIEIKREGEELRKVILGSDLYFIGGKNYQKSLQKAVAAADLHDAKEI